MRSDIRRIVESKLMEEDRPLTDDELEELNKLQDKLDSLIFFLKNEKSLLHPDNIRNNDIVTQRLKKVKPLMKFLDDVESLRYKMVSKPL